ncbi:MAG: winged helix-turn-helix transcriptional regulator [Bacteroidales bacterium]|nr:winged helix-turn-helix transcriptional regulator [Bacteroidales bacterium]
MVNKVWKALDDPTRRRILELLREGPLNAGELGARFNMTGASMSHHLNLLADAELVEREKRGQFVIYELNTTVFQGLMEWMLSLKDKTKGESDESNT